MHTLNILNINTYICIHTYIHKCIRIYIGGCESGKPDPVYSVDMHPLNVPDNNNDNTDDDNEKTDDDNNDNNDDSDNDDNDNNNCHTYIGGCESGKPDPVYSVDMHPLNVLATAGIDANVPPKGSVRVSIFIYVYVYIYTYI
jgi:hypothetical protein